MRNRFLAAIAAAVLIAGTAPLFAQNRTGRPMAMPPPIGGTVGQPPATPPAPPVNSRSVNQPGVPDTSTPGRIGTGATPSGLPGDSTSHPGYPGSVGGFH